MFSVILSLSLSRYVCYLFDNVSQFIYQNIVLLQDLDRVEYMKNPSARTNRFYNS